MYNEHKIMGMTPMPETVTILGTIYSVDVLTEEQDPKLETRDGYIDTTVKQMVLAAIRDRGKGSIKKPEHYQAKVFRHEIMHILFEESGLACYSEDEVLVDFLASQLPKIIHYLK